MANYDVSYGDIDVGGISNPELDALLGDIASGDGDFVDTKLAKGETLTGDFAVLGTGPGKTLSLTSKSGVDSLQMLIIQDGTSAKISPTFAGTVVVNGGSYKQAGTNDMTVFTSAANDTVQTGAGNDTITVGGGNDSIKSGAGDDTIVIKGGGNMKVDGGAGNDSITVEDTSGAMVISGGGGDDDFIITGSTSGTVQINGAGGADTLDLSDLTITDITLVKSTVQFTLDDGTIITAKSVENFVLTHDDTTEDPVTFKAMKDKKVPFDFTDYEADV